MTVTPEPGGRPVPLLAELWYVAAPDLDDPTLLAALRLVAAETEAQSGSITVPHAASLAGEQPVPLLTAVLPATAVGQDGKTRPDCGQTWDWEGAEPALDRCSSSILVTELAVSGTAPGDYPPSKRVAAINAVVKVLIETTKPVAISWPHCQRVSDPETFDSSGLDGVLNVRCFAINNDAGAMVMDTVGLNTFDLPDLQCHFRDFDPAQVAAMLFSTAVYVFDEGDVIDDGNTISGTQGDEHFRCRHELSLMDPKRLVIDVDLGLPYAAGDRIY
jgi:hypothetical protein